MTVPERRRTKDECLDDAVAALEAGLARQAARPPREAALAALGARASEADVTAWLRQHRPGALTAEAAS